MQRLLIEGLRFVPHSYACVNMWQCLELLKNNNFNLFHNDKSIVGWELKPTEGLFDKEREKLLLSIPPMPDHTKADIIYRIDFPHRFEISSNSLHFVFVTAEFNQFPSTHIAGTKSLRDAHANSSAVIVTPSEWSRQRLLDGGADESRLVVVPHGVDIETFKTLSGEERTELRSSLGWNGRLIFFSCGCMTPNKGMIILLQSFAKVARHFPDARLCLKGLDSIYSSFTLLKKYKDALSQEEQKSIEGRVFYIGGSMPFHEVARLYQAADIYVSPYMAEGFNLPVLEAAACGVPVICTAGGPTDEFTNSEFAKYISSQRLCGNEQPPLLPDVEHLTQLMIESVEDVEFRSSAVIKGPNFVKKHFQWSNSVDCLVDKLHIFSGTKKA